MIYGDLAIVFQDASVETIADAAVRIESDWLYVGGRREPDGTWHEPRWIPLARVKEVRRWDRLGWHASYDRVMALSDEQIANLQPGLIEVVR